MWNPKFIIIIFFYAETSDEAPIATASKEVSEQKQKQKKTTYKTKKPEQSS